MIMPHNRLHSLTRWPLDPQRRMNMAETDLAFVAALAKLHISRAEHPELDSICVAAGKEYLFARRVLEERHG